MLYSLGGAENIEQAAHCVTRLRLALKDPSRVDSTTLNQIDLVNGSFFTGGLYQLVIGPGEVEKVYAALRQLTGLAAATIADVKQKSADKINPMQRLVRVFSDVFMPILPALTRVRVELRDPSRQGPVAWCIYCWGCGPCEIPAGPLAAGARFVRPRLGQLGFIHSVGRAGCCSGAHYFYAAVPPPGCGRFSTHRSPLGHEPGRLPVRPG